MSQEIYQRSLQVDNVILAPFSMISTYCVNNLFIAIILCFHARTGAFKIL